MGKIKDGFNNLRSWWKKSNGTNKSHSEVTSSNPKIVIPIEQGQIDVKDNAREYSDGNFNDKVRNFGKMIGRKGLEDAYTLFYLMKEYGNDDEFKKKCLPMILGALGYLILPVDLVPDYIPVLGFTDDVAAITYVLNMIMNHWPADKMNEFTDKAKKKVESLLNNQGNGENKE